MISPAFEEKGFVGREAELLLLKKRLDDALVGKGSTTLLSGEAGIGKSRLLAEFKKHALALEIDILSGAASIDGTQPFVMFSNALGNELELFSRAQEYTAFTSVFAINRGGMLVAQSSADETNGGLDPDIFAGMLSAVQNFIKDSFDSSGKSESGLGRLEYGNMKIIIKHGSHISITAVLDDEEHRDMNSALKKTMDEIEKNYGQIIEKWSGNMRDVEGVQQIVDALTGMRFPIRRNLEGLKLDAERLNIANRIHEKISTMSDERPILLLLEDIHWADESSLFVLNYLARNIPQNRAMILGSFRESENLTLNTKLDKMRKDEIIQMMTLEKLDSRQTNSLLDSILSPNDLPEKFAENISRQCQGNPFFITEIIRHMVDDGCIALRNGRYELIKENYAIPGSVEEVIERRMESLEPDLMAIAEYASCIGQRFDVEAALSIPNLKDSAMALEKLAGTGIIKRENGTGSFSHGLFQEFTYNGLNSRWKQNYHRSLGEHYEKAIERYGDEIIYDIARHFSRTREHRKAFDYCLKAAEKAEASFALEQANTFYGDALSALPRSGQGTDEMDITAKLLERSADLCELMGNYDGAIANFNRIAEMEIPPETRARALRKLARIREMRTEYDEGLDTVARAKELLQNSRTSELALVMMNEGSIYEQKRELDRAISIQMEALEVLKEANGPEKDLSKIYNRIGTCLWIKNDMDAALEYFMKSLEINQRIGDRRGIASSFNNVGIVYIRKGDYNSAGDYLEKSRDIYREIGDQSGLASSSGNLGNVLIAKGDYIHSMEEYKVCLGIFTKIGAKAAVGMSLMNIASIHHHLGEFDRAMDLYNTSREIREAIGDRRGVGATILNIGNLLYDMRNYDGANENMRKAIDIMRELGDKSALTHALCGLARGKMKKDEWEGVDALIEEALTLSREMQMEENEMTALILKGKFLTKSGDWAAAEEALKQTIAYGQSGGYKRLYADAMWHYGLLFHKTGKTQEAVRSMEEARDIYREMKQPHMLKEIEEDLDEMRDSHK